MINSILNKVHGPLGEDDFLEPLSILLLDHKNESRFNLLGQFSTHQAILNQLKNRSKLYQFVNNRNLPKASNPIIVSGLPRSGTTFLFDLLHCDPSLRGPLTWEIFQMMPITNNKLNKTKKVFKTKLKLSLIKALMPNLMNMHSMSAYLPEECQQIMSIDFKSISWAYNAKAPKYEAYLKTCDYTSAILWHSRFLQALETVQKPKNWLLKDPCHIQHIPELLKFYPKAKFIFIHRDPVDAIPSISNLTSHIRLPFTKKVNKKEIGNSALSFWGNAVHKFLADRALLNKQQYIDIDFSNFIHNPIESIQTIYGHFGLQLSKASLINMNQYLDDQSLKKKYKHEYVMNDFDLNATKINEIFSKYISQFNLI
jgi:hypothetical protein